MKFVWIFAAAAFALALVSAGCKQQEATTTPPPVPDQTQTATVPADTAPAPEPAKPAETAPAAKPAAIPGLTIKDIKIGKGAEAVTGKTVTVHYTGKLTNGTKFDSSLDRKEPFTFNLGAGEVIEGWDKGVVGMKVGGKRKLIIAPELGYRDQEMGPIPANSTLIFEIELLKVG